VDAILDCSPLPRVRAFFTATNEAFSTGSLTWTSWGSIQTIFLKLRERILGLNEVEKLSGFVHKYFSMLSTTNLQEVLSRMSMFRWLLLSFIYQSL
jgi:hypothetical protein